jgi:AAA family ATP:ADP antiporter
VEGGVTAAERPSGLDRALRLFADVRAGEGWLAVLLALNVFLILTTYYILKPVREALILGQGSPELKTYLSVGQVALLSIAVPYYGRLAAHLDRRALLSVVTYFFVACLIAFYALGQAGVSVGIAYFLWIGIFNLMIVAQFWSFANDLYSRDEGERLFPIVGFGASLGAVLGALVAGRLIQPLGVYQLLLVGAALLAAQLQLTNYIDRHTRDHEDAPRPPTRKPDHAQTAVKHSNAFAMVFRTPYLLLIALMLLFNSTVDATGEYILGSIVSDAAQEYVADGRAGAINVEGVIGAFYSRYFAYINIFSLLLQLFVVSRVVKHLGVSTAVTILPALSLLAYNVLAFLPSLRAVEIAKVTEKGTDYSLSNTVRNMLFLPCTREEKYSAKQAIDSFFFRMGDVVSAVIVFVGTGIGLTASGFAKLNVVLAVVFLALAVLVGRAYVGRKHAPTVAVRTGAAKVAHA